MIARKRTYTALILIIWQRWLTHRRIRRWRKNMMSCKSSIKITLRSLTSTMTTETSIISMTLSKIILYIRNTTPSYHRFRASRESLEIQISYMVKRNKLWKTIGRSTKAATYSQTPIASRTSTLPKHPKSTTQMKSLSIFQILPITTKRIRRGRRRRICT